MTKNNDYWVMNYSNKNDVKDLKRPRWSQEEVAYLRQNFKEAEVERIAKFLKRSVSSIRSKAYREGLIEYGSAPEESVMFNVSIPKESIVLNSTKTSSLFMIIAGILGVLGLSAAIITIILLVMSNGTV